MSGFSLSFNLFLLFKRVMNVDSNSATEILQAEGLSSFDKRCYSPFFGFNVVDFYSILLKALLAMKEVEPIEFFHSCHKSDRSNIYASVIDSYLCVNIMLS